MSTYTLDFETMQQVMQEHQKTGLLYAELASGTASLREPCRVEIKIMTGAVASCVIIGKSGRRLSGKVAIRDLGRMGSLRWTFTPQQENVVPPLASRPTFTESATFPRRSAYPSQDQMRNWPRMHRAVFALADGTKSVEKMAGILSASPVLVEKTLRELQSIGVIIME